MMKPAFFQSIRLFALASLCSGVGLASCAGDVEDLYAHIRAFFRFDNVVSMHPLFTAVNNAGQWCTIQMRNSKYIFTAPDGTSSQANVLDTEVYGRPECVAGFIVGKPSMLDMNGRSDVQAYDLVCPSCYESAAIQRSLTFDANNREHVICSRCSRTYDLSSGGIVCAGAAGRKLYRYKVSYASAGAGTLLIHN